MESTIQTFGSILYSPSQYVIPVFQRNYRWEEPQWSKLWESLLDIQEPSKRGNHFMGFLVFVPGLPQPGQATTYHLIDGQQRLTTLSILLVAIRNVAEKGEHHELANRIHNYFLVDPNRKKDQRLRMFPKERDHDNYEAVVNRKPGSTGRIAEALLYFEGKVGDTDQDLLAHLTRVFETVCNRFEFMCATLQAENAYNIFKSLNSTGVPLGASDLIRNFVFMQTPPDEQDELDRAWWAPLEARFEKKDGTLDEDRLSGFFRDYLMSEGKYVAPKATFAGFESKFEATNASWRKVAEELAKYAGYYSVISGDEADASPLVTRALASLNALGSSTTYPLLLALFERRNNGAISPENTARAIDMLCGFILRRFICGESSRTYGQLFVRGCAAITADPLAGLESYLLERGWPDDARFIEAFQAFPLADRGYTKEILVSLERNRGHKEPADLESVQVEHILPQTLSAQWRTALGPDADRIHREWLHRPGNLTLTAYNQELWNHPFLAKREYYANSNIGITRELAEFPQWTESEIASRGRRLAKQAAEIWSGPREPAPPTIVDPSTDSGEHAGTETTRLQLEFWTEFNRLVGERNGPIRARKAQPQYWMDYGLGDSYFRLQAAMKTSEHHISVSLVILGSEAKKRFHQLQNRREEIEKALGGSATWWELPDRISSYLSVYRPQSLLRERPTWQTQHQWLIEKLELFHHTFAERIKDLD